MLAIIYYLSLFYCANVQECNFEHHLTISPLSQNVFGIVYILSIILEICVTLCIVFGI